MTYVAHTFSEALETAQALCNAYDQRIWRVEIIAPLGVWDLYHINVCYR